MFLRQLDLLDDFLISLRLVVAVSVFRQVRHAHIDAVQPHLVRIDLLMPETSVLVPGLPVELGTNQVQSFLILRVFRLLVDAEQDLARIDAVEAVFLYLVLLDGAVGIDHGIGIRQGIIEKLRVAITVVHIEHRSQFQPMTIVPLQSRLEIKHPRFGIPNHFRLCHTHRPRLLLFREIRLRLYCAERSPQHSQPKY